MSYSGDAAEQVVRMSLEGVEVAAKITGEGAKQVALLLYAIAREQKKTSGKARLSNLLRSGKELKVFAVRDQDLQRFCKEAKRYGVLYCVLKDRDATDGITDIMVRAEDASKINRIFERFDLATVDMGSVKSEIERSRAEAEAEQTDEAPAPPGEETAMTDEEQEDLLDGLLGPAPEREVQEGPPAPERAAPEVDDKAFMAALLSEAPTREEGQTENPTEARVAKSRQSEPTSKPKEPAAQGISEPSRSARPSVRQELNEIKAEQSERAAASREQAKPTKGPQHLAPRKKYQPKRLKVKER